MLAIFGFGWNLSVQDAGILETAPDDQQFIPGKTKVYLTNPSGERVGFTYKEQPITGGFGALFFGVITRPYFEPDPGVYDTLEIDETQVARSGVLQAFSNPLNPSNYTLTTADGTVYRYNETDGLQNVTDLNSNVLTFTDDGVFHDSGMSINFRRDTQGRIGSIDFLDDNGELVEILYDYDTAGDLVSFTNEDDQTTIYSYLATTPHYLEVVTDAARGPRYQSGLRRWPRERDPRRPRKCR